MALFSQGTTYYKLPVSKPKGSEQKDDVTYVRPELVKAQEKYQVIEDCIEGQPIIKAKREVYLRKPNATDKSVENEQRYNDLLDSAIFSNFVDQTRLGLKGQCFLDEPSLVIPEILKKMTKNVNGCCGINSLAESCIDLTLTLNRGGLFVDFPITKKNMSVSQKKDVTPSVCLYRPQQITNWAERSFDGKIVKSGIVLCEWYNTNKGMFRQDYEMQWRVLGLDENFEYFNEIWRLDGKGKPFIYQAKIYPQDGKGKRWNEIPFIFLSYSGDKSEIVPPPMYNLAVLNIGHFRNSASYEDAVFMLGEPTLVIAGLPNGWLEDQLKGKVQLGSRGGLPLPVGGEAYLLQVQPNTMVYEAMKDKESQMISLGAKMLQPSDKVKTATESANDFSNENSILISTSNSVSIAITKCLEWSLKYLTGGVDEKISFQLLTETSLTNMTANERMQLAAEWTAGLVTFNEARFLLRRSGIAFEDVDKIVPPTPPMAKGAAEGKKKVKPKGTVSTISGKDLEGNGNN